MSFQKYLQETVKVLQALETQNVFSTVDNVIKVISQALVNRLPLLVCGNGGSASDAMHISGELVGRFVKERPGLKVIALSADQAFMTAWSNDYSYETVFARQVEAYGEAGGVLLGLSTSGNSKNV
ncbi:MAG: SIS domain-containing protein, partial [Alphaproteobacteria bacterium]|nr:SIS domain-containing protein [Alphaproteobacteria bacterium]